MMEKNNTNINRLGYLFSLFRDKPYLLAKFLLDNNAFTSTFTKKINKSDKLNTDYIFNELFLENKDDSDIDLDFESVEEMNSFFNSLLGDNRHNNSVIDDEVVRSLNISLREFIEVEDFEKAATLRDFMIKKKIKILL